MGLPKGVAGTAAVLGLLGMVVTDPALFGVVLSAWAAAWVAADKFQLWIVPVAAVAVIAIVDPGYAYFAAIGICLIAIVKPDRAGCIAWIVAASAILSSFVWIPHLIEQAGPIPDVSPRRDFEFQPALTLAAAAGAILHLWRPRHSLGRFALLGVILLSFRTLLGIRVVDEFQVFFVLLAATALVELWDRLSRRHKVIAWAVVLVVLFAVGREGLHRLRHPPA